MEQINNEELWQQIEQHGVPCKINLLCSHKKTYTGAGKEYTPLWGIENTHVALILEEIKRDKENALWGRLKSGKGWIYLNDISLCEE